MVMLVTLEQAKDHLRVDTDDGDSDLTLKIHAASNAVLNYMGSSGVSYEYLLDTAGDVFYDTSGDPVYLLDSAGEKVVLPEIQAAVLIMLGVIYIDRDGQDFVEGGNSQSLGELTLPRTVKWLLDPLRRPRVA